MKANDIPSFRSTKFVGVLAILSLLACAVPLRSQERAAAPRLLIPIADVQSMLGLYGARGRVQIGFEKLPGSAEPGLPREVPPLDLTGVPAADGIRRILATDRRYTATSVKGILNIRPKASAERPSEFLDRIVTRFTLRGQPATVLMDRLPPIFGLAPPDEPRPAKGKLLTLRSSGRDPARRAQRDLPRGGHAVVDLPRAAGARGRDVSEPGAQELRRVERGDVVAGQVSRRLGIARGDAERATVSVAPARPPACRPSTMNRDWSGRADTGGVSIESVVFAPVTLAA